MVSHQEWSVEHVHYVQEEFWVCYCWVCDASIVCKWEIVGVVCRDLSSRWGLTRTGSGPVQVMAGSVPPGTESYRVFRTGPDLWWIGPEGLRQEKP